MAPTPLANSIVHIYRLDGKGGAESLAELPGAPQPILWVHMQSDDPECAPVMSGLGLSSQVTDVMTSPETRPRATALGEGVLMVLRGVNLNQDADPEDMVSLRMWLTDRLIVTARKSHRRLMSIQDVRQALDEGHGPATTGQFLLEVVERLVIRIGQVVDETEESLEGIEEALDTLNPTQVRHDLTELRRRTAQLKRYLAPQRDALDAMYRLRSNLLDERQAFELREWSDRTTRNVEDLDLARERANLTQEELRNRIAEQQNKRMYVLSLVTAIFLPLSFLTGVFGMNVMGLPGVNNPWGFVLVAAGMTALALGVGIWMRLRQWL
ncbi:MAG: zinc transporter ZntB [Candidatus Thiodiazotropha sp.]